MTMLLSFLLTLAFAKNMIPTIVEVHGDVTVENLQKQLLKAKSGQKLQGKARFLVPSRSYAKIQFGEDSEVGIYEDTEFEIPIIEFETNSVPKMLLKQGRIRYECSKNCDRTLEAALFSDLLPSGNFVFWMSPKIPSFEVLVLKGTLNFRGLENEKVVPLKENERGSFVGVKENGEIAYDVLLKGRKVARGELQDIQKASADELKEYSKAAELKKQAAEKKRIEASKPKKQAGQICEKPFAKFNECSWVATEAGCVRRKCNANGEWADPFVTSKREGGCTSTPIVAPCNY